MGGAEGVVYIDIAKFGQFGGKIRVIIRFLLVKSQVFQQQDIPLAERLNSGFSRFSYAIIGKPNLFTQQCI